MKMRNLLFILSILFILFVGSALADTGPVDNSNNLPSSTTNEPGTGYADISVFNSNNVRLGYSSTVAASNANPVIVGETIRARTTYTASMPVFRWYMPVFRWYWMTNPPSTTSLRYFQDNWPYTVSSTTPYESDTRYTFNNVGSYMVVLQYWVTEGAKPGLQTKVVKFDVQPPNPKITLTKTASPTVYKVGDTITYRYNVSNTGNIQINAPITITDNKLGTFTASSTNLAVGATATVTRTYVANPADVTAGSITNTATATGTGVATGIYTGGSVTSNTATATVQAVSPNLSITKTANPTTYSGVGQIITYTYQVTNSGNVPITAPIIVTDNKLGTFTISSANMAPGQTVNTSRTHTTTTADITAGSLTNTAVASGTYNSATVTSNTAAVTVNFTPQPALTLAKSANPTTYTNAGNVITYTYNVTNNGNVPITGPITVNDDKLGTITISTNNLAVGTSVQGSASYTIAPADLLTNSITNTATAHGTYNSVAVNSPTTTATVNKNPVPALSITKTATPDTYDMNGEQITYTYTVTNTGNVPITAPITISDNKINGGASFTISTNNLLPGSNVTGTNTYTITPADITARSVTNIATAHGTYNSAPLFSYPATATIRATAPPTMNVSKTPVEETFENVGDIITYEYVAWNLGGATLPGPIVVNDDKIGPINMSSTGPLPPETQITGTGQYTITEADVAAGFVTNTVTASGDYKGTTFSAQETATVYLNPVPELSITKAANPTTYTNVGDVITYTYNVTNSGNIPIAGPITVTDDKLGNITLSTSDLALGSSVQGTATHTIIAGDITAGSITNTATAHGNTEGLVPPTTSATVTYAAPPSYNLSIQDGSGVPQTSFGSGDNVHAVFTTTDTSLTQVTYVWKDPSGDIVNTDTVSITANTVSIYNPVTTGSWIVEVYPNTATTGTPLVNGTFNVAVPEFALAFAPLLLVGAVYVFMRRKYNK